MSVIRTALPTVMPAEPAAPSGIGRLRGSPAARLAMACLLAGLAVGVALSLAWDLALAQLVASPPVRHELVIPEGTAELVAQGAAPPSIPTSLVLQRGDSLLVINHDSSRHFVGAFAIDPGQSRELPIASFLGGSASSVFVCSFHPGNALALSMKDRAGTPSLVLTSLLVGLPLALCAFAVLSVTSRLDA